MQKRFVARRRFGEPVVDRCFKIRETNIGPPAHLGEKSEIRPQGGAQIAPDQGLAEQCQPQAGRGTRDHRESVIGIATV